MHTLDELRAGRLAGITRLQLSCGLTEFPAEIFTLADTLEILDLSGNALSALPDDLPRLHRLRIIFCSNNKFTHLPEVLGACLSLTMLGFKACQITTVSSRALPPRLRWLVLTDNQIESLPDEIGRLPLQKLMLAGNRLRTLPASLAAGSSLELLRIAANQLDELPAWLGGLPRLSWLAFAGNPFCDAAASASPAAAPREPDAPLARTGLPVRDVPAIPWSALTLGRQLGEGASGVIYEAVHAGRPVAVKLFKGAVTSDGLPDSEMDAGIAAAPHPNLIPVLGRVAGHPASAHGLVLALIDPDYRVLAGPPSLDSCTRDVYAEGKRFDLPTALRIARGVAAAARHLHARGILHGDLYAHNILHCPQGRPLLGDFGAASFYAPAGHDAAWLQRLEVRAFGGLLEELAARCDAQAAPAFPLAPSAASAASGASALAALFALATTCLGDAPQRPRFAEIEASLAAIAAQCAVDISI